jgi:hypothetical protein
VGLSLLAVFALAAVVVSSASATEARQPVFGRCIAKAGGKWANSGCSKIEAGKEKFEWKTEVPPKHVFKSKLKEGIPTLETVGGTKITCTAEHGEGAEITDTTHVGKVVAQFEGCETSKLKCESAGQPEGKIVTAALAGGIGIEKLGETAAKNKIASELHPETGTSDAEFTCAGLPVVVRGSILHKVTSDAMKTVTTEKFVAKAGEQKPEKYQGGVTDEHTLESNTNGGPFEEAGQTITAVAEFEEKVEINTTEGPTCSLPCHS